MTAENTNIFTLTDDNGNEVEFEYLDTVELDGVEYLVLLPMDDNEVVILEIQPVDEENESYAPVKSPATLKKVFKIFKKKYENVLNFEEE